MALCDELRMAGHSAFPCEADIGTEAARVDLFETITAQHGPLSCVVNNASLFDPDTGLDFQPDAALQQLNLNLIAPLSLARLLALSATPGDGRDRCAIHILDQKVYNLNPDYFSYTVSKLALERSVALQAQALAPRVRVCGVAPGLMFVSGPQTEGNFAKAARANLMRRAIDPADVAQSCVFWPARPA